MSERFVEVLDVGAEASRVLTTLASRAQSTATEIHVNVTSFLNATTHTIDSKVFDVLARHNVSREDVLDTLSSLHLNITNTTLAKSVKKPSHTSLNLMLAGIFLIVVHLVLVNVESKSILKRFSNHVD